jgi:4-diphosphocytidyl-2-C-methyl-D-erythritol kinase
MTVTMRSFAKINLGLRIGAARTDGFHELLTVYQTIALHDVIRVTVERGSGVEIQCDDRRVPRDESNTCWRITDKALGVFKIKRRVLIEIDKRLPVQGGLGGASANAVVALLALERALRKWLPAEKKLELAAEVGSDLPLFLVGGTVLGVGRGEQVYPLPDLPQLDCVVVTPEVGVSTPKAFAEWDRLAQGLKPGSQVGPDAALKRRSSTVAPAVVSTTAPAVLSTVAPAVAPIMARASSSVREDPAELRSAGQPMAAVPTGSLSPKLTVAEASDRMSELGRGLSAWLSDGISGRSTGQPSGAPSRGRAENPLLALVRAGIENDFEQVVFPEYPELGEVKRALMRAGAKYASLSGSGSTLYGLFSSRAAAVRAAAKLQKQGWAALATTTLTRRQYRKRMIG